MITINNEEHEKYMTKLRKKATMLIIFDSVVFIVVLIAIVLMYQKLNVLEEQNIELKIENNFQKHLILRNSVNIDVSDYNATKYYELDNIYHLELVHRIEKYLEGDKN